MAILDACSNSTFGARDWGDDVVGNNYLLPCHTWCLVRCWSNLHDLLEMGRKFKEGAVHDIRRVCTYLKIPASCICWGIIFVSDLSILTLNDFESPPLCDGFSFAILLSFTPLCVLGQRPLNYLLSLTNLLIQVLSCLCVLFYLFEIRLLTLFCDLFLLRSSGSFCVDLGHFILCLIYLLLWVVLFCLVASSVVCWC